MKSNVIYVSYSNWCYRLSGKNFCFKAGCVDAVKLDNLRNHRGKCIQNLDAEVTCDKRCKLKMPRREYLANDCFGHFEYRIRCLEVRVVAGEVDKEFLYGDIRHAGNKVIELTSQLNGLTSDVHRHNLLKVSYHVPPKWQRYCNMKIDFDAPNFLENNEKSGSSLAVRAYCLDSYNHYFSIRILSCNCEIRMGLVGKESENPSVRPSNDTLAMYKEHALYASSGVVISSTYLTSDSTYVRERNWSKGDEILCGVKFPKVVGNEENIDVEIYFWKNNVDVAKFFMRMPCSGLFPAVEMLDCSSKISEIKYISR